MLYELKHKNISVLEMDIDEDTGAILKVNEVYEPSHIPMGIRFEHNIIDRKALNHWFMGRSIPASRENIAQVLEVIGEPSTRHLISKCYGLSLSDCYWICPKSVELDFDNINFFEHEFSKDMGEILFGNNLEDFSLVSPDNTSDGWLKKKWIIKNGERYLVKGASGVYKQEPFNEKIASIICKKMDISYVDYEIEFIDRMPYSICKNFLSKDVELISAWSVYSQFKKPNQVSPYEHLVSCYEKIGVKNPRYSLEQMIILDFLIGNTDRHMNNFGVVRNSNTLEILGVAPIFDSGTSLFMSMSTRQSIDDLESKPFAKTHQKQIALVENMTKLNIAVFKECKKEIDNILSENPFMDRERKNFVLENYEKQVYALERFFSG